MGRIVLVGSEKGGVSKTSTAFNLAVTRAKAGHPVLLVDADKQASASMLSALRAEEGLEPRLVCVQKLGKIGVDLVQLSQHYELVVDAGGQDSVELRQAIAVATDWLIPVQPAQLDIFVLGKMRRLLEEVEAKLGRKPSTKLVLSRASPLTKEAEEARAQLVEAELPMTLLETVLVDRVAWRKASIRGCGLCEMGPSAALEELLAVYREVYGEEYHEAA